jgi:hypothetical protein
MMECKTSFISIYIVCNIYIYIIYTYIYTHVYNASWMICHDLTVLGHGNTHS